MIVINIYAGADHIVHPGSARPLNDLVGSTDKELYEFKGGHIGVFVGHRSRKELVPAIAKWLYERQAIKQRQALIRKVVSNVRERKVIGIYL